MTTMKTNSPPPYTTVPTYIEWHSSAENKLTTLKEIYYEYTGRKKLDLFALTLEELKALCPLLDIVIDRLKTDKEWEKG